MKRWSVIFSLLLVFGLRAGGQDIMQERAERYNYRRDRCGSTIFINTDAHFGNYLGYHLGVSYVLPSQYSLQLGYSANFRPPNNKPGDYSDGLDFLPYGKDDPRDVIKSVHLLVGKALAIDKENSIQFLFHIGVGLADVTEVYNWEMQTPFLGLTSNYRWQNDQERLANLIFNPKIEWWAADRIAFNLQYMFMINKDSNLTTLGVGVNYGFTE